MNQCGMVPNTKSFVLDTAINKGLSYGMRYLEIYGVDILDTSLSNSIQKANIKLINKGLECSQSLPIHFLNFNGINQNNINQLSWTTTKETFQPTFIIQRSDKGTYWEEIGTTSKPSNYSTQNVEYSFIDNNALNQGYFYRIKHVDIDNEYSFSKVIYITNVTSDNDVYIYPNPANNKVTIKSKSMLQLVNSKVTVINSLGVLLKNETLPSNGEINISDLPSGNYIIELKNSTTEQHLKFVKEIV